MSDQALEDAVEFWLRTGRRRIVPRFPTALEAVFEADNAASKLLGLRICIALGVLTGVLILPALWHLMPDIHDRLLWIWGGLVLPIGALSEAALWLPLPIRWQERQAALAGLGVASCLTALVLLTRQDLPALYLGGMLLLEMLYVIATGVRFGMAAAQAATLVVLFAIAVAHLPRMDAIGASMLTILMVICSIFAVFGCWRAETGARHSYALILRERLSQRALSRRNSELDALVLRDPLTGLANRRAYDSWQNAAWQSAASADAPVGLVVVDIDHFKRFNDFYGHAAGDACLQTVTRCMAEQLRGTTDLVARLGGEEFAILLPGASLTASGEVAERMRLAVEALELPHGGCAADAVVTISCGASSLPASSGFTPACLFAAADAALYEAKMSGRNRVCLAEQTLPARPLAASRASQPGW